MKKLSGKNAKWLTDKPLQSVFDALETAGGEVRVNGGAVRNTLMGEGVGDIDLSTNLLPEETVVALEAAGIKAIPTGIEHGTITGVADGKGYEITTLREDIETTGRHAVVRFGKSWIMDAQRRDLTMNALYSDRNGQIFDPLNGMVDIESRTVRFIGTASERIEEDYLRILRFFRFFAWYGSGRPDGEGLKACAKHKAKLESISAERIWAEIKKMLLAKDPSRALLWMRTTGVLTQVLPETEKWGIDLIPALIEAERANRWLPDPMLRLMAMLPPRADILAELAARLKLSNEETARLIGWSHVAKIVPDMKPGDLDKRLYREGLQPNLDVLALEIASLAGKGPDASRALKTSVALHSYAKKWKRPEFPVKGEDLLKLGRSEGPELGKELKDLEARWLDSGFKQTKQQLLSD